MSLDFTKVNYVDGSTIIEADNLNDIQDAILELDSNKVEAESGKGLSTEDYTSAEKSKLSGIQAGAQVNPGNATTSADGLMSSVDKAKLDGIASGATAVTIDSTLTVEGQAADAKATGDAIGAKYTKPNGGIPKADLDSNVQASLGKADTALQSSLKGEANGLAELDNSGKVPTSQLPSFVDDVLEYASLSEFPVTGETGKIYVATDTNKTYRWGGTTYIEISASLALGETSSTAYRGDRGAAAYTHAVTNKGSAFSNGLYKITTNSEGHVTAATSVTKNDLTDIGVYAKPDTGIPKTDLASDVQSSLGKADTALQAGALPAGGTDGDVLVKNGVADYNARWEKPQYSRPNLLDNWYFGDSVFPINQRGQATYVTQGPCIDRWRMRGNDNGSVAIASTGVTIALNTNTESGNSYKSLDQLLDKEKLQGKTVTLSCLVTDYVNNGADYLYLGIWSTDNAATHSNAIGTTGFAASGLVSLTVDIPSQVSETYLKAGVLIRNSAQFTGSVSIKVQAIKLELGDYQTLAHNEGTDESPNWVLNELPDYGQEVSKCRRKYIKINKIPLSGFTNSAGRYCYVNTGFEMDGTVALTVSALGLLITTAGSKALSGVTVQTSMSPHVCLRFELETVDGTVGYRPACVADPVIELSTE